MNYNIVMRELETLKQSAMKKNCVPLVNKIQSHLDNLKKYYEN